MLSTFYLRMFDSLIEQAENSTYYTLAAMRDVQTLCMAGMKMAFRASQTLNKRSKYELPLTEDTLDLVTDALPMVMKAQYDLAAASINASLDMARSIREDLTTHHASQENGEDHG